MQTLITHGIRDCDRGNYQDSLRNLDQVVERLGRVKELPPRALSAYGLALAASDESRVSEAIGCCRFAIRRKPGDPMLYRLLAKAYLLAGARRYAVHTIDSGLKVDPRDAGLRTVRGEVGVRTRPLFGSLDRTHPLNVYAGKLRYRLKRLLGR